MIKTEWINWLTDRQTDQLTIWLSGWLVTTSWPTARLTVLLTDWLVECLILVNGRRANREMVWLIDWPIDQLIDQLSDWLTDIPIAWLIDWPIDWSMINQNCDMKLKSKREQFPSSRIRTSDLRMSLETSTVLRSTNWAIEGIDVLACVPTKINS